MNAALRTLRDGNNEVRSGSHDHEACDQESPSQHPICLSNATIMLYFESWNVGEQLEGRYVPNMCVRYPAALIFIAIPVMLRGIAAIPETGSAGL